MNTDLNQKRGEIVKRKVKKMYGQCANGETLREGLCMWTKVGEKDENQGKAT